MITQRQILLAPQINLRELFKDLYALKENIEIFIDERTADDLKEIVEYSLEEQEQNNQDLARVNEMIETFRKSEMPENELIGIFHDTALLELVYQIERT